MDQLEAKLVELIEAIESGVVDYGPEALQLILNVMRVEAVGEVIMTLIGVVIMAVFGVIFARSARRYAEIASQMGDGPYSSKLDREYGTTGFKMMLSGIVAFVATLVLLIEASIWSFAGAFWPELRLAREIIDRVLGGS